MEVKYEYSEEYLKQKEKIEKYILTRVGELTKPLKSNSAVQIMINSHEKIMHQINSDPYIKVLQDLLFKLHCLQVPKILIKI
jgi:rRNA processing protein Krr1/Pno1